MLAKKRQCIFALIHEIPTAEGFMVSTIDGNSSNDGQMHFFNDGRKCEQTSDRGNGTEKSRERQQEQEQEQQDEE